MPVVDKAALRGEPSYVWRAGQERRFDFIADAAGDRLQGRILDNGCGIGMYLPALGRASGAVYGLEFEPDRVRFAHTIHPEVIQARGEALPLPDGSFDLVLSHEVLEHVEDDRRAMEQICRILRRPGSPGLAGRLVLFVPNRGYPFETHGIFWRGRYSFGNKPFVNYLPRRLRDRLAPHVRTYTTRDLERLIAGLPLHVVKRTIIFGAYDNIIARYPRTGRVLRAVLQSLERTPFRRLGLSHLWVLERTK
jgi:SAM-dependent methyltransferase